MGRTWAVCGDILFFLLVPYFRLSYKTVFQIAIVLLLLWALGELRLYGEESAAKVLPRTAGYFKALL